MIPLGPDMRVPETLTMTRKNKQKKLRPKTREKKWKKQEKTTRGKENKRKMYLKLGTCWIAYTYNVALDIKALSTQIWIFLKLHIFFSQNGLPSTLNQWIRSFICGLFMFKNMWFQTISRLCGWADRGHKLVPEGPEGLGNCSFDLLAELCSDISSTKRHLSLTFKKSTRNK